MERRRPEQQDFLQALHTKTRVSLMCRDKQAKHGIEDRKVFLQCSVACHKLIQLKSFKLVSPTFSHHQYGTQMQDFDLGSQKRGSQKVKERWLWAFRKGTYNFNVSTTNGLERQNECLKYDYLKDMKKCCLSDMINVLLTEFSQTQ